MDDMGVGRRDWGWGMCVDVTKLTITQMLNDVKSNQ